MVPVTFERFQLLKSPLKELASQNMDLGGGEEGCAESEGEE